MTPEELRISIINFAMQGKLVEQRESEGSANDLYDDILKVAKKDKNVLPILEENIPFEIPSSWKWCRFGEITNCSMGKTPPRAEAIWWGEDIPWVSISDMTDYGHVVKTKEKVSRKALEERFGEISKAGTLLMSFKLTVGRTSILDIDALHNEAIISIFPYVDKRDYFRDYLFYILPIITQWGESKNAIKGKTLNSKSIANLMLPLAPLEEMHRIVAKIEELLPYVDRYAEAYEKMEQFNAKFPEDMKKSILQYAIQGKLVEQRTDEGTAEELYQQIQSEKQKLIKEGKIKKDKSLDEITEDEIPFDIPETWMWVRFDELAGFYNGDRGKNYPNKSEYVSDGIAWINTGHILPTGFLDVKTMNYITEEKYNSLSGGKIMEGDLVYCLRGATYGKVARIEPFSLGAIASSLMGIRPVIKELREYIYLYLKSPLAKQQLSLYENGSAQQNLAAKDVRKYLVPLPPLGEQKRIIEKVNELLPLCERLLHYSF